jgi:C-terminal processing protease CtpA/Prc
MKKSLLLVIPVLALMFAGFAVAKPEAEERNWIDPQIWESFPRSGFRLGVVLSDPETESGKSGLSVVKVLPGSPAEKAGIQTGDILISINGEKVRTSRDVREFLRSLDEEQEVPVVILRNGQETTIQVVPEKRSPMRFMHSGRYLGLSLQKLDSDMAAYFQVDPNAGILVTRVDKNSPAETAGVRSGDVITHINGKKVTSADEVREAVQAGEGDVEITLLRHGVEKKLTARPEKRELVPHEFERFRELGRNFDSPEFRENMDSLKEEMEDLKRELQDLRKEELNQLREEIQRELKQELENLKKELKREKNET